jgi:hypothetical protein
MMQSTIRIDSNECNAANLFCISSTKEMSPVGLILNCSHLMQVELYALLAALLAALLTAPL